MKGVMTMIALSVKDLKLSYGIDTVLDGVTFSINEGDKVALIGANGAGKTTLFRILTGTLKEFTGEFYLDRTKTTGYLSQDLALTPGGTVHSEALEVFRPLLDMEARMVQLEEEMEKPYTEATEAVHAKAIQDYVQLQEAYDLHGGHTYKGELHRVVRGLGFAEEDFEKSVDILSGGQKTRLALAKLLLRHPDILLLDEPTNHLDLKAIEWLEEYLKGYRGTLLLISHDRFFLDSITTHTFEIINGKVYTWHAPYTRSLELKEKEHEVQMKAYRHQQEEIHRQEKIIERYRSFNREKSIRAAESRQKMLDKVERLEAPPKEQSLRKLSFSTEVESGVDVLVAENLKKAYEENLLFEGLSFHLRKGERVALIGENGRGKTTLLRMILGEVVPDAGSLVLGRNVTLGYYDQEQSDLHAGKTVFSEIHDDFPFLLERDVRTYLGSFLFRGDDVFKTIDTLSGGEKCRVNLLKLMLRKSNFLLLDEPTNHLDIPSREVLEKALMDYDGTLFVISHDRYFLNKVVDNIFELHAGGVEKYLGNYSYYLEKKTNPDRFQSVAATPEEVNKTRSREDRRKRKQEELLEKQRLKTRKTLEERIEALEVEKSRLSAELTREEVYSDVAKSLATADALHQAEEALLALYAEWEALL